MQSKMPLKASVCYLEGNKNWEPKINKILIFANIIQECLRIIIGTFYRSLKRADR